MSLNLHHLIRRVAFTPVDPLGDGLREEIIAEQAESERIVLEERPDENELMSYLELITSDIKGENDSLSLSED